MWISVLCCWPSLEAIRNLFPLLYSYLIFSTHFSYGQYGWNITLKWLSAVDWLVLVLFLVRLYTKMGISISSYILSMASTLFAFSLFDAETQKTICYFYCIPSGWRSLNQMPTARQTGWSLNGRWYFPIGKTEILFLCPTFTWIVVSINRQQEENHWKYSVVCIRRNDNCTRTHWPNAWAVRELFAMRDQFIRCSLFWSIFVMKSIRNVRPFGCGLSPLDVSKQRNEDVCAKVSALVPLGPQCLHSHTIRIQLW